jgi:hypothetical protein
MICNHGTCPSSFDMKEESMAHASAIECERISTLLFCSSNRYTTLTPKTESMFHSVSFHAPYFENEWAKSKWVNTRVVVSKVYYNCKRTWSKKQLRFGSKWISKLTTRIDSVVWLVFGITKNIGNAFFL